MGTGGSRMALAVTDWFCCMQSILSSRLARDYSPGSRGRYRGREEEGRREEKREGKVRPRPRTGPLMHLSHSLDLTFSNDCPEY